MVVGVFGDEGEVEERDEVRGRVGGRGEVHLHNAEVGDGEFGTVRAVQYVQCGADNGGEERNREDGEDGPEAAAAAEIAVGALAAAVVVGLRSVNLTVGVVQFGLHGSGIAVSGGGAVNCAVSVGFGGLVRHFDKKEKKIKWEIRKCSEE